MTTAAAGLSSSRRAAGLLRAAVFLLAAALLVAPWLGHFDDTDAQLYQVVIRKMAERRAWLDPSYLDHYASHFREHLPFGIWPYAAARIAFGEQGPRALAAVFSLLTLAGIAWAGRKLAGEWPAAAAVLVLATTETFFRYGAATRLDPLLVLLANAAAVPALLGSTRGRDWTLACAFAALAALVKGPFGLVPLLAASGARAAVDRSAAPLLRGAVAAFVASLPVVAFLLLDKAFLHSGWWETYGHGQLLASATGARLDGAPQWWFPFATAAGRFWPGMALIAAGAIAAIVRRRLPGPPVTLLAIFCLLMLAALCLPGRKVWNHALVAYPGLALLAGAALLPAAAWLDARARAAAAVLAAIACAAVAAAPLVGRLVDRTPCVGALEFRQGLDRLRPGDPVLVVSSPTSWRMLASLAAERGLEPDPRAALPPAAAVAVAIMQEDLARPPVPSGWSVKQRARGWMLLERVDAPR